MQHVRNGPEAESGRSTREAEEEKRLECRQVNVLITVRYSEAIFPFSEDIFNGRYIISIRRVNYSV
jgi:hypothetical protein